MKRNVLLVTSIVLLSGVSQVSAQNVSLRCGEVFKKINLAQLPKDLSPFPEQPALIKSLSEKNIERLKKSNMAATEAEIKALGYKQAMQEIPFQNGSVFIEGGHLVWKKPNGVVVRLVDKDNHKDRGIANILISPDGKKVAYSTTLSGSDQHVWYIQSIATKSRLLVDEPILVRMDGFSWGQDSNTVYFSHFAKVEDANAGTQPFVKVRSLNLKTKKITDIFSSGERENFAIYDVDGGKTLLAHRILGPGAGIKALLSVYRGDRQKDGSLQWTPIIAPNSTIGHFLGVIQKDRQDFAVMHTNQLGSTYGITLVPLATSGGFAKPVSVVAAPSGKVLHNSQMHQGRLFLEYYDPKSLETSFKVVDANSGKVESNVRFSDYGVLNHGTLSLPVSFSGNTVTMKYVDVLNNVRVFSYDLQKKSLTALANPEANPFDASRVRVATSSFKSADGTVVRGLKIFPVDAQGAAVKPKFFFLKAYGMIGIKYAAEPLEAQLTVSRGGVYFVPEIRGGAGPNAMWQVTGARDFNLRYQDMAAAAKFITQQDAAYAKYGFDPKDVVIFLGRSYNGSGMLNMAARYSEMARLYVSVVPVWDTKLQLREGRFGVIAHSDYFPKIDPVTGKMILDAEFFDNIEQHNPANLLTKIPKDQKLIVYTGGRDDRVDLVGVEENYIGILSNHLGDGLSYIQNPTASHGPRWYFEELFTEIDLLFPK